MGETAPLLFTAIGSQLFNLSPFQPTAAIPIVIYTDGTSPFPADQQTAWGAAFVLLVFVLILSIGGPAGGRPPEPSGPVIDGDRRRPIGTAVATPKARRQTARGGETSRRR